MTCKNKFLILKYYFLENVKKVITEVNRIFFKNIFLIFLEAQRYHVSMISLCFFYADLKYVVHFFCINIKKVQTNITTTFMKVKMIHSNFNKHV